MKLVRSRFHVITWLVVFGCLSAVRADFDYRSALTKSIIFLEAQRSGKLPATNRVPWRGDSALDDGKLENIDLAGGYYDAGDNVKFGLPMAFTVTTLAWAGIHYRAELQAAGEMDNVRSALRWGTDYLLKASAEKNKLYVEVGDPHKDHACWANPENMDTPRTVLKIDQSTPGTEIAAETAAALASSSIVFRDLDRAYAGVLLTRAKALYDFAKTYKGSFSGECPFYCSHSGPNDELLWGAAWLYYATKMPVYLDYVKGEAKSAQVAEFSWDLKYAGAQILLYQFLMEGEKDLKKYKEEADGFVCSNIPGNSNYQVFITPGGMINLRDGANSQYVTGVAFLFSIYSDYLTKNKDKVYCSSTQIEPAKLAAFAKQQMDYLLGKNPENRSYMVGFGKNPPTQAHHRGASIPKLPKDEKVVCGSSFGKYLHPDKPNVNELTGAILGGPNKNDKFEDKRNKSSFTEPCTYINSLAVGALAKLAKPHAKV
ncbi:endoglucanase 16 [Salvia hispanica]|uniref:endoglucanase 16 n=1 Tax=Salvia hispanica TaxID=49212 RepID=UPI002009C59A|nr:endoglucanase 16 [Salvia hispanica]